MERYNLGAFDYFWLRYDSRASMDYMDAYDSATFWAGMYSDPQAYASPVTGMARRGMARMENGRLTAIR